MSPSHDLHRALLRPAVIHTLRAAGFHSTKPSVLDTVTNLAERYLLLLATATAQHARSAHNDAAPTVTDARLALTDCGVLVPVEGAAAEEWTELMRLPVEEMGRRAVEKGGGGGGGGDAALQRMRAAKRKREDEDLRDVREFGTWFDGPQHREVKRIAGMIQESATTASGPAALAAVGVGGGKVVAEDFLTALKKKSAKAGAEDRLLGTVLGDATDDREVVVEGGPVQRLRDWRPKPQQRSGNGDHAVTAPKVTDAVIANGDVDSIGDILAPS